MSGRTVALIGGTGKLGIGIAHRLARAGITVLIGSRSESKAVDAARRVDQAEVRGLTNPEAARLGDLLIVTVPYAAHQAALEAIRRDAAGKVVVDTTVPLVQTNPVRVERPPAGSAAEAAQRALPAARVVAAFHTVSAGMLVDLTRPLHGDVLLCGDDKAAKAMLADLVQAIGMRPVDAGPLSQAHVLEQLAGLVLVLNRQYKRHDLGIAIAGLER